MPWDSKNYPTAFKSLDEEARGKAIVQAEAIRLSAVEDGSDEDKAVLLAIGTALKNVNTTAKELVYDDVKLARLTSLQEMKKNFDDGVLGTKVAIDIAHTPSNGAAAWVKGLSIRPSTTKIGKQALFADIEWTGWGKEQVPRYDYISAEYGKTTDPESQKQTKNVLKAATLTNRPFVRGMRPVSDNPDEIEILREGDYTHPLFGELNITNEDVELFIEEEVQGETMDKLTKFLQDAGVKLEDNTSIEDVALQFIEDQSKKVEDNAKQVKDLTSNVSDLTKQLEEAKASDDEPNVELTELNERFVKLSSDFDAEKTKTVALETKLFEQDRDVFLSSMVSQGRMLPAERDNFKKLYGADKETTVAVLNARTPVVDLQERGGNDGTTLSYEDRLHNEAVKLQNADSDLSYQDAVIRAENIVGLEE